MQAATQPGSPEFQQNYTGANDNGRSSLWNRFATTTYNMPTTLYQAGKSGVTYAVQNPGKTLATMATGAGIRYGLTAGLLGTTALTPVAAVALAGIGTAATIGLAKSAYHNFERGAGFKANFYNIVVNKQVCFSLGFGTLGATIGPFFSQIVGGVLGLGPAYAQGAPAGPNGAGPDGGAGAPAGPDGTSGNTNGGNSPPGQDDNGSSGPEDTGGSTGCDDCGGNRSGPNDPPGEPDEPDRPDHDDGPDRPHGCPDGQSFQRAPNGNWLTCQRIPEETFTPIPETHITYRPAPEPYTPPPPPPPPLCEGIPETATANDFTVTEGAEDHVVVSGDNMWDIVEERYADLLDECENYNESVQRITDMIAFINGYENAEAHIIHPGDELKMLTAEDVQAIIEMDEYTFSQCWEGLDYRTIWEGGGTIETGNPGTDCEAHAEDNVVELPPQQAANIGTAPALRAA